MDAIHEALLSAGAGPMAVSINGGFLGVLKGAQLFWGLYWTLEAPPVTGSSTRVEALCILGMRDEPGIARSKAPFKRYRGV